MEATEIKHFVEAALLAAGRPLSIDQLHGLFDGRMAPQKAEIRAAIATLNEEYEERGLVDAIINCNEQVMVVGVEAYFAYYRTKTIVDRLREDVILPLRSQGIEEVWLLGTSMGGVGTFLYRAKHPEEIDGIIAIAPFLGERDELDAYLAGDPDEQDNKMAIIWDDLNTNATGDPKIILGFGAEDSLAPGIQWLAPQLPKDDVVERPGGHDWETWSAMWEPLFAQTGWCSG